MKKRILAIQLNIGYWVSYLVLVGVILGVLHGTQETIDNAKLERTFEVILFIALLPSGISFYSFYYLIFPRILHQKNHIVSGALGLVISIISALIGFSIISATYGTICGSSPEEDTLGTFIGINLFISLIALINGVIALVIRGFVTWIEEIKLKEQLKQKNHEMEMALVKAQLDPHFLFNTINNIDVLIIKNSEDASNYLNKLSDIMRFMLFENKTDEILLSKEIEYIDKYIELQKIRTANSNYISFKITGNPNGKIIAPMVFIPFIENAFKHTTNKKLDRAIVVEIVIKNDSVKLSCINKIDPLRKTQQESNGLGNELIIKRLHLIYPDRHTLKITNENNLYCVTLAIQNG